MAEVITTKTQGSKTGRLFFSFKVTYTAISASQESVIQFPPGINKRVWFLMSQHFNRTDGTAANYQFSIGDVTGFTTGTGNELLLSSSEPVGTVTHDTHESPIPMWSDSDFKLFFKPGFDAGSDNDGTVELIFFTE